MAGTLFVVATPIGHLDDITLRALRTLREAAVVAAEDTRRTRQLLRHFDIPTPLVSLHEHNERRRAAGLLERLGRGDSVALVSDAGTPGISDPGAELVRLARAQGIRVEPIPGASAVAAAVSVAGLEGTDFAFMGFPPIRSSDRNGWFGLLAQRHLTMAVVFFEAPHRITQTLEKLSNYVKSPILVCRELTKMHEEIVEGLPGDLATTCSALKGEFTIVVPVSTEEKGAPKDVTDEDITTVFGQMTNIPRVGSRRDTARAVAKRFGISTKRVYEATKHLNYGE